MLPVRVESLVLILLSLQLAIAENSNPKLMAGVASYSRGNSRE